MATMAEEFEAALTQYAGDFQLELQPADLARLRNYYELLLKWNERLHLVAPCSPAEFAVRHVLESLLLLKHLPQGSLVTDIGSGGGLPIIPCLLLREDLQATLIESSQRKAVFLNEALRALKPPDRGQVAVARFQDLKSQAADFITSRALNRFSELLPALIGWAHPKTTFLLFAGAALREEIEFLLPPVRVEHIPHSEKRFLLTVRAIN